MYTYKNIYSLEACKNELHGINLHFTLSARSANKLAESFIA